MLVGICAFELRADARRRARRASDLRELVSVLGFVERVPAINQDALFTDGLSIVHRRTTRSDGLASVDVAAAILLRHFEQAIM